MIENILFTIITAATPFLIAAIGELVVERSGILNLGVEGMMIIGAVFAFMVAYTTKSPYLGVLAGLVAGGIFSLLFGFVTITMVANQVATGLALTILGLGLAGMVGEGFVGVPGVKLPALDIPLLSDIPIIGKLLFGQDIIVYISFLLVAGTIWFLFKTHLGLTLRSVGDNPSAAHALGISVSKIRYGAVFFGGCCAGLAGAYLSLVYVPQWTEGMTSGRGWIALALVVFASWRPERIIFGAYLFGTVTIAQFHAQAVGIAVPSQLLSALPFLATIIVLILISRNRRLTLVNTPASLGKIFVPDR